MDNLNNREDEKEIEESAPSILTPDEDSGSAAESHSGNDVGEYAREDDKLDGETRKIKTPFTMWVENFFYHYKWHTIISLFLVFVIAFCSFQMCQKTEYDLYIMYAGGTRINTTVTDGSDSSDYAKLSLALKQYTPDVNDDGENNLNILNLYIPDEDVLSELADNDDQFTLQKIIDDKNSFRENILYGPYQLCFISEHSVADVIKNYDVGLFCSIYEYLPAGNNFELYEGIGVYLRSTPLKNKPGFNLMAEDTIICIRSIGPISSHFDKKENEEHFRRSEDVLRALLLVK